jgi:hypothetical protein
MDTLRNGVRFLGAAFMNSELMYSFLMGVGWFFLAGWALALLVACASVFRNDRSVQFAGFGGKVPGSKLGIKPGARREGTTPTAWGRR